MHWVLWVGPLVLVTGGLFWLFARPRKTPQRGTALPADSGTEEASDPYRDRILAELGD